MSRLFVTAWIGRGPANFVVDSISGRGRSNAGMRRLWVVIRLLRKNGIPPMKAPPSGRSERRKP